MKQTQKDKDTAARMREVALKGALKAEAEGDTEKAERLLAKAVQFDEQSR